MKTYEDTITAIATVEGEGAIAIVRLSGKDAISIADKIFKGKTFVKKMNTHTIQYGHIIDPNTKEYLDEVIIIVMHPPRTFTREMMVEINCHGGRFPTRRILQSVLDAGARLASPGEFTLRAFLNGRLDLIQAEAVAEIIQSRSELSLKMALGHLEGDLSKRIDIILENLDNARALIEVTIDFSEEDLEAIETQALQNKLEKALKDIEELLISSERGLLIHNGLRIAIVGQTNVGKSSLFNALLGYNRAIVTHIAGTTRDTLEGTLDLNGIPITLIDTAGLRDTDDLIEQEGVKRSKLHIETSCLLLWLLDASLPATLQDWETITPEYDEQKILIVLNKSDLKHTWKYNELEALKNKGYPVVLVSSKNKIGFDDLSNELCNLIEINENFNETLLVSNMRHIELLKEAKRNVKRILEALNEGYSWEFLAIDLQAAQDNLGELIGKTVRDDVLERIFSQFCIGK